MRLKKFVHGLILALCSMSTVLAAKDTQTDIGAISHNNVEIANSAVAGVNQRSTFPFRMADDTRQSLLLAASDKSQTSTAKSSKAKKDGKSAYESFRELDVDAEKLMREVLDLSSDIEIVDEQHVNPPKNQLLVLVTLQPSKFFELDYVELKVDGQVVAAHPYSESDIAAMVRGGGHRLYLANLPAGTHELKAKFSGKVPRDPDYQREASFKFIAGVNRTLIELYINSADSNSFPQFTVREWN